MFDYRIQTFLKVCETLNYTKAAQQLHMTQPAVSQQIHYLEKKYQTELFKIQGKQVNLTPAGMILQHSAETFLNDEKQMMQQIQSTKAQSLPLYMGATVTIGEFVLTAPLSLLLQNNPELELHLTIANTSDLLYRLQNGSIHFALVEGFFKRDEFECLSFSTERFLPICHAGHTFQAVKSAGGSYRLEDLFRERLLLREQGSGTREILQKSLEFQNYRLDEFTHTVEINSMYTILQFLLEDCGISFLYEPAVKRQLRDGILKEIPVSDFHAVHDFTFIWNRGSIYAAQYRGICEQLKECRLQTGMMA